MALGITRRFGQVVVAGSIHPEHRHVLATFLAHLEPELVTVPATAGQITPESISRVVTDQTAAVVVQYPNFFGQLMVVPFALGLERVRGESTSIRARVLAGIVAAMSAVTVVLTYSRGALAASHRSLASERPLRRAETRPRMVPDGRGHARPTG